VNKSIKASYLIVAVICGTLFGSGLYVSQMVDPLKVLKFLDFGAIPSGNWDPSLAFVIVAAILVMFIGVKIVRKKETPILDNEFHLPDNKKIDHSLIIGSIIFGLGWGMSGICPGPAISLIAFMPENLIIFLLAMFAGSFLGSYVLKLMAPIEVSNNGEKFT